MSSILKRILKGHARPAVMRPVPMVPMAQHPARAQTVETLELRVRQALPPRPAFGDPDVGADATPRSLLMSADRVRHMGDCKVAQLEREVVMERLRVKELREKLAEYERWAGSLAGTGETLMGALLNTLKDSLYIGTDEVLKARIREKVRAAIGALEGGAL